MKVFVVVGIHQGVPTDMNSFTSEREASQRGYELAAQYGVLQRPWDWSTKEDGRWNPRSGSQRGWHHHWYNDESDVFVGECEL